MTYDEKPFAATHSRLRSIALQDPNVACQIGLSRNV